MTIAKMDKISPSKRLVSVVDVFVAFIRGDDMSRGPLAFAFHGRQTAKTGEGRN